MPGLADQLAAGSIATLEAAAPWRRQDAEVLEQKGRRGAAVYLYGYVAEIRLCAACYRIQDYASSATITDQIRKVCERDARDLHLMGSEPHHLPGWARYLVHLRRTKNHAINRHSSDQLLAHVDDLYAQWRPRLRYKTLVPTTAQLKIVVEAVDWLDTNYNDLWS